MKNERTKEKLKKLTTDETEILKKELNKERKRD